MNKTITVYYAVDGDGSAWLFPYVEPIFDRAIQRWRRPRNAVMPPRDATDKHRPVPCKVNNDCDLTCREPPQLRIMLMKDYQKVLSTFKGN